MVTRSALTTPLALCAVVLAMYVSQPAWSDDAGTGAAAADGKGPGDAQKSDASTTDAKSDDPGEQSGKSKSRVLEGGVKGTAVPLEEGLARISVANQAIQETCMAIMKEATRKDTIVMRGPNVLPGGIVIPALGGQGGVMQMGEMPIHRNKLNKWIENNEQNVAALQTYVDALIVPPGNEEAAGIYNDLRNSLQSAQEHLSALKELSVAKRLINTKIGREALALHDAIAAMERRRSQLAVIATPVVITSDDEVQKNPPATEQKP